MRVRQRLAADVEGVEGKRPPQAASGSSRQASTSSTFMPAKFFSNSAYTIFNDTLSPTRSGTAVPTG
jgi:hypothetical protein